MDRLRGVNFGGWFSQIDAIEEKDPEAFQGPDHHMATFLGEADFHQMSAWGFNHVRLPIDYFHFFNEEGQGTESRLVLLDNAVRWAEAAGLQLILDLHESPGHDFHDVEKRARRIFAERACLEITGKIWTQLATRYAERAHVIFELLNEPVAPTAQHWNTVKDELFSVVRKAAPQRTIIFGSNMWNWPATFSELTPVDDENVIYCFHFYEPLLFTHQRAPWLPEPDFRLTRDYPGDYGAGVVREYGLIMSEGVWNMQRFRESLAQVIAFQKQTGATVICDEFGTFVQAPRAAQLRWLFDFLAVLRENDIGFSYWNYKNLDFGIFSKGEGLHAELPQYQNSDRCDLELLEALRQG